MLVDALAEELEEELRVELEADERALKEEGVDAIVREVEEVEAELVLLVVFGGGDAL